MMTLRDRTREALEALASAPYMPFKPLIMQGIQAVSDVMDNYIEDRLAQHSLEIQAYLEALQKPADTPAISEDSTVDKGAKK